VAVATPVRMIANDRAASAIELANSTTRVRASQRGTV
jgi:hypothetical protein